MPKLALLSHPSEQWISIQSEGSLYLLSLKILFIVVNRSNMCNTLLNHCAIKKSRALNL